MSVDEASFSDSEDEPARPLDERAPQSHFEFLVAPALLDRHLENLKSGDVQAPSAAILLRGFLKESHRCAAAQKLERAETLLEFAAKVCSVLGLKLYEIEDIVPLKNQRQLFHALIQNDHSATMWKVVFNAWILRGFLERRDAKAIFDVERPPKANKELLEVAQKTIEEVLKEAFEALSSWADTSKSTSMPDTVSACTLYVLGVYEFYLEKYEKAKTHLIAVLLHHDQILPATWQAECGWVDLRNAQALADLCNVLASPAETQMGGFLEKKMNTSNIQDSTLSEFTLLTMELDSVMEASDELISGLMEVVTKDLMHGELILPDLERLKEEQKLASVRGPLSSLILIRRALETEHMVLSDEELKEIDTEAGLTQLFVTISRLYSDADQLIKEPLVFLYGLPVSDKEGRKELFWRLYSLIEDVLLSLDRHDVYLIAKEHVSGLVQDSNSDLLDYFESVKRKANHSGKMSAMNEVIESLKIYDDESGLSPKKKAKGEGRMTIQTILSDEVNLLPLAPFRKFLESFYALLDETKPDKLSAAFSSFITSNEELQSIEKVLSSETYSLKEDGVTSTAKIDDQSVKNERSDVCDAMEIEESDQKFEEKDANRNKEEFWVEGKYSPLNSKASLLRLLRTKVHRLIEEGCIEAAQELVHVDSTAFLWESVVLYTSVRPADGYSPEYFHSVLAQMSGIKTSEGLTASLFARLLGFFVSNIHRDDVLMFEIFDVLNAKIDNFGGDINKEELSSTLSFARSFWQLWLDFQPVVAARRSEEQVQQLSAAFTAMLTPALSSSRSKELLSALISHLNRHHLLMDFAALFAASIFKHLLTQNNHTENLWLSYFNTDFSAFIKSSPLSQTFTGEWMTGEVSLSTLLSLWRAVLWRLYHFENSSSRHQSADVPLYAIGDCFRLEKNYSQAITFYLMGAMTENELWSEPIVPDRFAFVLLRLIDALLADSMILRPLEHMEAIALYQLLPAAPYDTIFSLIAEHYKVLNPNMFEFIYDLNIYEALIATYAKCDGFTERVNRLRDLLGKPQMNPYNDTALRKKFILNLKLLLLKELSQEYLSSVNLPFLIPEASNVTHSY